MEAASDERQGGREDKERHRETPGLLSTSRRCPMMRCCPPSYIRSIIYRAASARVMRPSTNLLSHPAHHQHRTRAPRVLVSMLRTAWPPSMRVWVSQQDVPMPRVSAPVARHTVCSGTCASAWPSPSRSPAQRSLCYPHQCTACRPGQQGGHHATQSSPKTSSKGMG